MKPSLIRFFTPSDNVPRKGASPLANPKGYITTTGKLVFPPATLAELGIEANTSFKIGNDGKRKIDTLYLVPTEDPADSFLLEKRGRGYVIPLATILKKGGVSYQYTKYTFTAALFKYDDNTVGYVLELTDKPVHKGKRRGRKPKATSV